MSRKSALIVAALILVPVAILVATKALRFEGDVSIGQVLEDNGFVELKPPTTLVPPGTWVSVLNTHPLHLSVVCTPDNSLGLADNNRLLDSSSANLEMISRLKSSFHLGAESLFRVKADSRFAEVRSISFRLKDVRVVEVPDDVVMQGLTRRVPHCRDAIRFRIEQEEPITMVKAVLIADAEYHVEFSRELAGSTKADLRKGLALELGLKLGDAEDGSRHLVGRDLIWGVREDASLAKVGLGLPPTGGADVKSGVLSGKGAVTDITLPPQRRTPEPVIVAHSVRVLRQDSPMSCWATVYAMMKSWKDNTALTVSSVVAELGAPWINYYLEDKGLPGGEERGFVERAGMESRPPANYTVNAYVDMLRAYGPLWIITGDGISAHARLLVGVYGSPQAEGIKAYEETTFEFIDPKSGTFRYQSGSDFVREFESEARWLVDGKLDDVEFRHQILHWPKRGS